MRAFGQELVDRYSVPVDISIHAPERQGDQRNWHAHVLTTTRTAEAEGLGAKTRILDAKATGPLEVEALRESWAGHINRALEREHSLARVDHRSFERRDVDRTPTTHLGPTVVGMERQALRDQGLSPEKGMGIVEAMAQPGFKPATDRGLGNVMAGLRNRILEWTRSAEQTLERAKGAARPLLDRVASMFDAGGRAGLPATREDPVEVMGELRAARFVEDWRELGSQHDKLFRFGDRAARQAVEARMRLLAENLKSDPEMREMLRQRRHDLGLRGSTQGRTIEQELAWSVGRDRGMER